MFPGVRLYLCVMMVCVVGSAVGAPPDKNYQKVEETKWGVRSAISLFLCFIWPPYSIGGSIRHNERGTSGNYLTVDYRGVIADALDTIDEHVTNNYARLQKVDGWFWIGLASALGVQVEILWLIVQVVLGKRDRARRNSVKVEAGGTQERSRVWRMLDCT